MKIIGKYRLGAVMAYIKISQTLAWNDSKS